MKKLIYTASIALYLFTSCTHTHEHNRHDTHEEQETHDTEGVVELTPAQVDALGVKLGTFQMRNLTTVVKTNGQLEVPPAASADVTAIIGGNVREIKVFHGDEVRKGQALAILEHPDYITLQEEFADVAHSLEFLELEYERQKELFENNVGAGKDFQQVKSEHNTARARYAGLRSRLQLLNLSPEKVKAGNISNSVTITSPIKGYVNDVNIKVGTYIDARDKLFEITDNSEIHADFMVYEKDAHLLEKGQKVDFTVANLPDQELTGSIFAIGRQFEANIRAVHIHVHIDNNPGNLIPGMFVTGHIHTDEVYTKALPENALVTEGTKSYIFVLTDTVKHHEPESAEQEVHMTFRMVEVVAGKSDEGYTEVKLLDSLPDDALIVLNTAYYLLSDLKKAETEHAH